MVIRLPSDGLGLYDGYIGPIDGLCYIDFVCGDWAVPNLISNRLFIVCVDGHPKSCLIIIASSAPLTSFRWKNKLLLSNVMRNVHAVVWPWSNASLVVS